MKIFSDPSGIADLSRLNSDPIEVADAAISAILRGER